LTKKFSLKICIIGAGRLGTSLAASIVKKNNPLVLLASMASRSDKSLDNARAFLNRQDLNILFTKNNFEGARLANCIFICTPDDEIEKVCRQIFEDSRLAEKAGGIRGRHLSSLRRGNDVKISETKKMFVLHFSGSKKTDVLDSARQKGVSITCMHPLKSFASIKESVKTMKNTVYGVTYDRSDVEIKETVDTLLDLLEGRQIFIENNIKPLYHACACIASNYLVNLMNFAVETGQEAGLDPEVFLQGILNLSEGTMENIKKLGAKKALTGPIARGDLGTVREHVENLRNLKNTDLRKAYGFMGIMTAKIAFENSWIDDITYKKMLEILKS